MKAFPLCQSKVTFSKSNLIFIGLRTNADKLLAIFSKHIKVTSDHHLNDVFPASASAYEARSVLRGLPDVLQNDS